MKKMMKTPATVTPMTVPAFPFDEDEESDDGGGEFESEEESADLELGFLGGRKLGV